MAVDDALETLRTMLMGARDLASKLTDDPQLPRLIDAFGRLPAADREPILKVLERDAAWCRIVEQTADATGITVRANPYASLFVQVVDPAAEPPAEWLRRDVDVVRLGIERLVQLLPLLFAEGVHEQWTASARELIEAADPALRALAGRLAREVLGLLGDGTGDPSAR